MLELKNVTKTYQTKSGAVNALDRVSLTFPATGMVFITGKSGCGKTTLLNVIGGLDGVTSGDVSVLGKSFSSFTPTEYDGYRNSLIGFIFQEYNLLPEFSVEKNIKIATEIQGRTPDQNEIEELMNSVDIKDLKNRKINELSGGQRQRVAIARALLKKPRIIMADEPTGALDSKTGIQVLDTLKKLSKDKLIIIVSHDREFAEKYADRIIRLVDGRVEEDVTFTENEVMGSVFDTEQSLIVRNGATLSETEKDVLANAVKEKKKIEITDKPSFREKQPTGKVENVVANSPVTLQKSKMSIKSAGALGLKSLSVKPLRLIFTILLSAFAFAVFGLFDTIANFSTARVLNNILKNSTSKMVIASGQYIVDQENDDKYNVKLSDDAIDVLEEKTGYSLTGIYDFAFSENRYSDINHTVHELASSSVILGKNYYTDKVTGAIELTSKDLPKDGSTGKYGFRLVKGSYPAPVYTSGTNEFNPEALTQTAVSTYFAKSILHYLEGNDLNGKSIQSVDDLLGAQISLSNKKFTIVGLIDCGDIPAKYDELKTATSGSSATRSLSSDFSSFINSNAYSCLFLSDGYLKYNSKSLNASTQFYAGSDKWSVKNYYSAQDYVYAARHYNCDNVLLFYGDYPTDGKLELADNEVLIHPKNLSALFSEKINALESGDKERSRSLIKDLELDLPVQTLRQKLRDLITLLFGNDDLSTTISVTKKSTNSNKQIKKDLVVKGVYFGIDTDAYVTPSTFKFMMNDNLMSDFNIYRHQGEYSRVLISTKGSISGYKTLSEYMTKESGLNLVWYKNSALNTIRSNEPAIRQAADLFLYVAIILALFSVFMFFNYIVTSIVNKRPSIGVLRGLGAGGKDIFRMFLIESIIIALINAVLATGIAAIGCVLVNAYIMNVMHLSIPFALFGIRQFFIIFGMSIFTAVASSILPIIRIAKEKPVDLIRKP